MVPGLGTIIDLINLAVNSRGRQLKSKCCLYTKIRWLKAKRLPIGALSQDSPIAQLAKKYTPRDQDEKVRELLREGTNYPLLAGSSWVGKTRSVYEILKDSAKDFLRGYWVVWPHRDIDENEIALLRDFPWRRPKVILLFDNIDWYVQTGKHHRIAAIIERFQGQSKELRVVATLRSDPEDIKAVELLKQDAAWQKFKEVDYNLNKPSFILQTRGHLEYMQGVYRRLAENERKILWALKILRRGMVAPLDVRAKALFVEILNGEEKEFEPASKRLKDAGFAGSPRSNVTEVHDIYLERVVEDFLQEPEEIWQLLLRATELFEKYGDVDAINQIGISFYLNERYDDGLRCFDAILKMTDKNHPVAWNDKSVGLFHRGRLENNPELYREAIECCDRALELLKDYPEAWNNKGLSVACVGRYHDAIECFDKALKLRKDFPEALSNKGNALTELGKREKRPELFEEAIECYDRAIELRVDFAEPWSNKGVTLGYANRYEEALSAFERALQIRPDYAEAWNNKGQAFLNLGRQEESLVALEKALQIRGGDYAHAWNNKAIALSGLGRQEESLKAIERAIELDPNSFQVWNTKGNTLVKMKRYDEAVDAYDRAQSVTPDTTEPLTNKAAALIFAGRYKEALQVSEQAIEVDHTDAGGWYNKACSLSRLERTEEMLEALKEAVRLDTKYKDKAQKEEDFKAYWEDEDFKAIVR